jgi:transposase
VLVADRWMVTRANIDALAAGGGDWITALKAPQVKKLARSGTLQPSLFDEINLAEITSEEFPGKRLVVCRNPLAAGERTRKREDLLAATESDLAAIRDRVERDTLTDAAEIGLAVGPALKRFRMKKHFEIEISDGHFAFQRKRDQIAAEQALDGIYVLRTSLAAERADTAEIVRAYKDLQHVEAAFRVLKGPELEIRPIHHRLEHRVRAHVFCCMLALYLERHLRDAWTELTYQDQQPPDRPDPVAKAHRSTAADHKAATKRTPAGHPAHSFRSLLAELALQTRNTIALPGTNATFDKLTEPTPLQARALQLATT